jgi:hypothetical protein
MSVPSRPAPGAPIDAAWGVVVHDAAVAQDIQSGTASVVASSDASASLAVTFPRPFAAAPVVLVSQSAGSAGWIAYSSGVSATGFSASVTTKAGNAASATVPVAWVAIGPRA